MNIEAALSLHLRGYPGLSALVSTRIYPMVLPQSPTLPAVTYQRISGGVEYVMDGSSTYRVRFQIDCWASSYTSAKSVSEQVRAALNRFVGTMGGTGGVEVIGTWIDDETDLYEPDTKLHRVSIDVLISHK